MRPDFGCSVAGEVQGREVGKAFFRQKHVGRPGRGKDFSSLEEEQKVLSFHQRTGNKGKDWNG